MALSLADLRTTPPTGRPERSVTVCLAPELVARVQKVIAELDTLRPQPDQDGNPSGPPRTVGGTPGKRALEDELRSLLDQIKNHEGELTVRANMTDGEWRQWVNAHPSRVESEKSQHERDNNLTGATCDSDALIDTLGAFVHAWNGEPLAAEDWAKTFEPRLGTPDKYRIVREVVSMYEVGLDFPLWRSVLSAALTPLSASSSLASSESATGDSTDGSPAASSAATTEKATA